MPAMAITIVPGTSTDLMLLSCDVCHPLSTLPGALETSVPFMGRSHRAAGAVRGRRWPELSVSTTVSGDTFTTVINGVTVDTTTDSTYGAGRIGARAAAATIPATL